MKIKLINKFTDFGLGIVAGFMLAATIFGFIFGVVTHRNNVKEIRAYAERQIELQVLREDYINRDAIEFIDTIPDVRRAADSAADEFERKRDEAVHRFRNRFTDR